MNIEHSDEDSLESKLKISQDKNQAQVKKALSKRGQRIKTKREKRLQEAEKRARKIKAAEARAREKRRVTLLQEAQVNQEKRRRQAEIRHTKEEQHRLLCELWIEQQNVRCSTQNVLLDINKQEITELNPKIETKAKNKPQKEPIHQISIHKLSSSKELTTCPYCQCSIRANNLAKHTINKCSKAPIDKTHRHTERKKEKMPKFKQKILLNSGQCNCCGRAAVPGSSSCYSCSS